MRFRPPAVTTIIVFGVMAAWALPAAADDVTETPTPVTTPTATPACTPPPAASNCVGAKRFHLSWSAKNPQLALVSVSGTHCPVPAVCGAASGSQTTAPIVLTITDAACRTLSATFNAPGVNSGDCPGGKDTYKGSTTGLSDKARFIYGSATTMLGTAKIPLSQPSPPTITPPVQITFRDAAGYTLTETVTTCFTSDLTAVVRVKCF